MTQPTQYPIVAALVSYDVTYEGERPVYVRPIVLTSEGFQVRRTNGLAPINDDHAPVRHFRVSTDEKVLGVIPAHGSLIQLTKETDEEEATWEFKR